MSTDFDTKLKRLLKEVVAFLGIPKSLEIERKFLIEYPDIEFLNSIKTCRRIPITQAYLTTPEDLKTHRLVKHVLNTAETASAPTQN